MTRTPTCGYCAAATTLLKFRREFDAFLRCARLEPAEIARRGRRAFVLMSADHTTGSGLPVDGRIAPDTATVVINTVERAEMGPEHATLDELLK
jgi:glutaredoxin